MESAVFGDKLKVSLREISLWRLALVGGGLVDSKGWCWRVSCMRLPQHYVENHSPFSTSQCSRDEHICYRQSKRKLEATRLIGKPPTRGHTLSGFSVPLRPSVWIRVSSLSGHLTDTLISWDRWVAVLFQKSSTSTQLAGLVYYTTVPCWLCNNFIGCFGYTSWHLCVWLWLLPLLLSWAGRRLPIRNIW